MARKRSKAMATVMNIDVVMAKFLSGHRTNRYMVPNISLEDLRKEATRHVMSMVASERARATRSLLKVVRKCFCNKITIIKMLPTSPRPAVISLAKKSTQSMGCSQSELAILLFVGGFVYE